jgi:hypothetical protein
MDKIYQKFWFSIVVTLASTPDYETPFNWPSARLFWSSVNDLLNTLSLKDLVDDSDRSTIASLIECPDRTHVEVHCLCPDGTEDYDSAHLVETQVATLLEDHHSRSESHGYYCPLDRERREQKYKQLP